MKGRNVKHNGHKCQLVESCHRSRQGMIQERGTMLLLWSAGTRLSLLFEEDRRLSEKPSSKDSSRSRRSDPKPNCVKPDDSLHTQECPQLPKRLTNQ